ncbi:MAG: hypothetical protein PHS54_05225 [Clostridia bacterium]|nr:hypothetical protein [Clostridia bacterium]
MLKVYQKTQQEIDEERSQNNAYARMVKGHGEIVCPCYVVKKDGTKLDVWGLKEEEILSFVNQSLREGIVAKTKKAYDKNGGIEVLVEASKLTKELRGHYTPSDKGLKSIIELFEDDNQFIRSWSKDILTPLVSDKLSKVNTIAEYLQETNGNFDKPTKKQLFQVIDQLSQNEQNKNAERKLTK